MLDPSKVKVCSVAFNVSSCPTGLVHYDQNQRVTTQKYNIYCFLPKSLFPKRPKLSKMERPTGVEIIFSDFYPFVGNFAVLGNGIVSFHTMWMDEWKFEARYKSYCFICSWYNVGERFSRMNEIPYTATIFYKIGQYWPILTIGKFLQPLPLKWLTEYLFTSIHWDSIVAAILWIILFIYPCLNLYKNQLPSPAWTPDKLIRRQWERDPSPVFLLSVRLNTATGASYDFVTIISFWYLHSISLISAR